MINAGSVQVKLFADTKQYMTAMTAAGNTMTQMGKKAENFATTSIAAFAAFTAASAKMATDFDKRLREISTLIIGVTEKDIKNMSREIRDLANTTGKSLDDIGKAKYDIISAGFTGMAESAQLLDTATRLAVGGVTSVTNSADLLTSALNSFQKSGFEAEQAADILFTTVRLGKTTMDELVGSVGRVFPTAQRLGASLADVGAAMATITAGGIKTYEAATYLNQAFTKLGAPSDQAARAMKRYGIQVYRTEDGMLDLFNTIKQFKGYDLETMRKFFPEIRAIKAVLAMANNLDFLNRALKDTNNAVGATQTAFEKMEKSFSVQMQKSVMKLKDAMIEIGNKVMPSVVASFDEFVNQLTSGDIDSFADSIGSIASSLMDIGVFVAKNGDSIIRLVAAFASFGAIKGVITTIRSSVVAIGAVLGGIGLLVSPITVLATAISAVTIALGGLKLAKKISEQRAFNKELKKTSKEAMLSSESLKILSDTLNYTNKTKFTLDFFDNDIPKDFNFKQWIKDLEDFTRSMEMYEPEIEIRSKLVGSGSIFGLTREVKKVLSLPTIFDFTGMQEELDAEFDKIDEEINAIMKSMRFDPLVNWGDKLITSLNADEFINQVERMSEIWKIQRFDVTPDMIENFDIDLSLLGELDKWLKILKIDWEDLTAQDFSGVFDLDAVALQSALNKFDEMGLSLEDLLLLLKDVKDKTKEASKSFEGFGRQISLLFSDIGNSISSTMANSFAEIVLSGRVAMQELEK